MEHIHIQQFANINKFTADLTPLLVFSGNLTEDKSALARLIAIFRNWEFQGKLIDYQTLFERFSIRNFLTKDSRIEYQSDMRRIIFNGQYFEVSSKLSKTDENIRLEEIFRKQVIDVIQTALDEGNKSNKPEHLYAKLSELKININSLIIIPSQRNTAAVFSEVLTLLKGSNLPIHSILADFIGRFEIAKKHFKTCELEPWKLIYNYENNDDNLLKENHFYSKLSEAAPGIQSILLIKIILEFYAMISAKNQKTAVKNLKKLSYLVEEPELHLHSELFPYVIDTMLNNCNLNVDSLIVTTNNNKVGELIREKLNWVEIFDFS